MPKRSSFRPSYRNVLLYAPRAIPTVSGMFSPRVRRVRPPNRGPRSFSSKTPPPRKRNKKKRKGRRIRNRQNQTRIFPETQRSEKCKMSIRNKLARKKDSARKKHRMRNRENENVSAVTRCGSIFKNNKS